MPCEVPDGVLLPVAHTSLDLPPELLQVSEQWITLLLRPSLLSDLVKTARFASLSFPLPDFGKNDWKVGQVISFRIDFFSFQRSFAQKEARQEGNQDGTRERCHPSRRFWWAVLGAVVVSDYTKVGWFHSQLFVCGHDNSLEAHLPPSHLSGTAEKTQKCPQLGKHFSDLRV